MKNYNENYAITLTENRKLATVFAQEDAGNAATHIAEARLDLKRNDPRVLLQYSDGDAGGKKGVKFALKNKKTGKVFWIQLEKIGFHRNSDGTEYIAA